MLVPIPPEYVVVGAMLVVVFEEVVRLWHPFDQLALLELVQFMTDLLASFGCVASQNKL